MDELRINKTLILLPEYGEMKLIIKDGKIVQYVVSQSHIFKEKR